jgi:hypothetical protein
VAHLISGHVPHECAYNALLAALPFLPEDAIVVVRSLDSARDPQEILSILAYHEVFARNGPGYVSTSLAAMTLGMERVLVHFDEVWVCDHEPPDDLLETPIITSEQEDFRREVPRRFEEAFLRTDGILALGDGCGLNYATTDSRIADAIEGR